jgi:hypothetical protein
MRPYVIIASMTIEERLTWDIETAERLLRIATAKLEWTKREIEESSASHDHVRMSIARIDAPAPFLADALQAAKSRQDAAMAGRQRAEREFELAADRLRQLLRAKQQLSATVPQAG